MLYLFSVPFAKLGFPDVDKKPYPAISKVAIHAVPPAVIAIGALLGGVYAFLKRRAGSVASSGYASSADDHGHPEFEPLGFKLLTPFNWALVALMIFGAISLVARFALGLGGSTHLSNTYACGLWIVFDLVWIAVAAGAFATAGLIYVFQRHDLYSMECRSETEIPCDMRGEDGGVYEKNANGQHHEHCREKRKYPENAYAFAAEFCRIKCM